MCGIVGIVQIENNGLSEKMYDIFTQMLIANSVRGVHGTGVFKVSAEDGLAHTIKVGGNPFNLIQTKDYADFIETSFKDHSRILIGHNRFATVGEKSTKNAHPFVCGNITMVHNGTLKEGSTKIDLEKYDVDSEALCAAINEQGIDEAMSKTHGAWTIVYYDKLDRTLNILRNSERPLFYYRDDLWSRMFIASEHKFLEWILSRNYQNPKPNDIVAVPADTLLTIPLDGEKAPKWKADAIQLGVQRRRVLGKKFDVGPHQPYLLPGKNTQNNPTTHGTPSAAHSSAQILTPPFNKRDKKIKIKGNEIKKAHGRFAHANDLLGIRKEDKISFQISDIVEVNPDIGRYLIRGKCTRTPRSEFLSLLCYVNGEKKVEELQEAGYITAKVQSIMVDTTAGRKYEDRQDMVWVSHPEPIFKSLNEVTNLV
jgi:hypothetical protein